ncbi:MAG: hypothetical protein K6C05_02035 [Anaerovibrio sp.]|uniref:hypothetical protein n=1 Tax=Anaerovibrio sp. TaxID=1872532 RepID=UPI0025E0322F|nr:hypothetical protein [Anaerovibrio sp.]MCR5175611.1 hypothetical protein [Anaerovibrio sp.]
MPDIDMTRITDNLLRVYNYAFIEDMPYGFFKPNDAMYVGVRLVDKMYHCPKCGERFTVRFKNDNDGITYFSKSRIEAQKGIYDELGIDFPANSELAEKEFTYHTIAMCSKCAEKHLMSSEDAGQKIYNLCHRLHMCDELMAAKGKKLMTDALSNWLEGIKESGDLLKFDLSTHEQLRNLICAVILQDTDEIEKALGEYRNQIEPLVSEALSLLEKQTPAWEVWAAHSSSLPESMSDKEYHEYTVAFPADDTVGEDFYIRQKVEQEKVRMFLEQHRLSSVEEVLMDTGFHEEWVDMVVDKGTSLVK